MNEKELRDESYKTNSSKEDLERNFFDSVLAPYFNIKKYKHNPIDSWANKAGSDVTAYFGNIKRQIDLKGYDDNYDTVALSYGRSYDGEKWFSPMIGKITTDWFFIDPEARTCYVLTLGRWNEIRNTPEIWQSLERRTVEPSRGGHWQKVVKIPKSMLWRVD